MKVWIVSKGTISFFSSGRGYLLPFFRSVVKPLRLNGVK